MGHLRRGGVSKDKLKVTLGGEQFCFGMEMNTCTSAHVIHKSIKGHILNITGR